MTKALVIGYGSIGARHARLLKDMDCTTAVVSHRAIDFQHVFQNLADALRIHIPDYVVIANATDRHHSTLESLAELGYRGTVIVEKPLFDHVRPLPAVKFRFACVAYNLRFHPVVRRLKELLKGEEVLSVQAYAGQYLPEWRPGSDYRKSYSASATQGGGVLRDLSHELDYLGWILGGWSCVAALGGHISQLEISSDDIFSLLMNTPRCPVVSVQLNYLDRRARRTVLVNTAKHTIEADLVQNMITIDCEGETFATERDTSYRAMHESVLSASSEVACSLDEGMATLRLIDAAELSARRQQWICQ